MLDELGHVTGLAHHDNFADDSDYLDSVVQTVSRARPKAGWNAHAFGRCDQAKLQLRYGRNLAGTKFSTCLDLGTTLGLAVSDTSIPLRTTVTFTATLRTARRRELRAAAQQQPLGADGDAPASSARFRRRGHPSGRWPTGRRSGRTC